jgi:hypothetical protein
MVSQLVFGLMMGLGLVLVVWMENLKGSEKETDHYLDLRKDSQKAQELSLSRLHREQELEKSQREQRRTAQE